MPPFPRIGFLLIRKHCQSLRWLEHNFQSSIHRSTSRLIQGAKPTLCTKSQVWSNKTHSKQVRSVDIPQGTSIDIFSFPSATHDVKSLHSVEEGKTVIVHGYLGPRSDISKTLSFVPLLCSDQENEIQIVSHVSKASDESFAQHAKLKCLRLQTPVAVKGELQNKKPSRKEQQNESSTVQRELLLHEIHELNSVSDELVIKEETNFPPEQRYLQIRTDKQLRKRLHTRAQIARTCRKVLERFVEVETPILFKSTAEGAREFLVPTRARGMAYALPQSPQQYKQILMASGISKYYQLARCFRDEDLRADRQPEFTQLDLEMAFAKENDVMAVIENLLHELWQEVLGITLPAALFPRLTYEDAMRLYGSDKPDRRLGMEITRLLDDENSLIPHDLISKLTHLDNPIIDSLVFRLSDNPDISRQFINKFMLTPAAKPFNTNPDGQPGVFVCNPSAIMGGLSFFGFEGASQVEEAFDLKPGDILIVQARKKTAFNTGSTTLGNLRLALYSAAVAQNLIEPPKGYDFLWVTDFPLFTQEDGTTNPSDPQNTKTSTATISSTHHPFTAPRRLSDLYAFADNPTSIRATHYDIVVNGVELGGGSQRIHSADAQRHVFENLLRLSPEAVAEFEHLLQALRAGCPPHAGIALGFDRLVAVMTGTESVRDVIAFPKSGKGEDSMMKSPGRMTEEQLAEYHLRVRD